MRIGSGGSCQGGGEKGLRAPEVGEQNIAGAIKKKVVELQISVNNEHTQVA